MTKQTDTGKAGEEAARNYLASSGYEILHSNWRWRHYEIDIIAVDGEDIVFIEVKTRAAGSLLAPEESVTRAKIRRIVDAADEYVRYYDIDKTVRFDIISVVNRGNNCEIEHIEDAFRAPFTRK
jgi:putative endonuclease